MVQQYIVSGNEKSKKHYLIWLFHVIGVIRDRGDLRKTIRAETLCFVGTYSS